MEDTVVTGIERLLDDAELLDARELAGRLQEAARIARVVASVEARLVSVAERSEAYRDDAHRSVRNWVQATVRVRRGEADDLVRLAALGAAHPVVIEHLAGGTLGIAQAHALARVHANARVADRVGDVLDAFVTVAEQAPYETFVAHLRSWEQLTDSDGVDPDRGHDRRHAGCTTLDGTTYLNARLSGVQGAEVAEILERFAHAEFAAEWDELKAELGDDACPGRLRRTESQRRADAVVAIFRRAASADPGAKDPEPVVNIVVGADVYQEQLRATIEARRPHFDTLEPSRIWAGSPNGLDLLPADILATAFVGHVRRVVIDSDGRIIDFGRRRRLFTGAAREAAIVQHTLDRVDRCLWPGCGHRRTQHDHAEEWHRDQGVTNLRNEGPLCPWHNVAKTRGYRTWRDPTGTWHTVRPDGTEIEAA